MVDIHIYKVEVTVEIKEYKILYRKELKVTAL